MMEKWTALWRIPIFVVIWILFLMIKVPTLIAGWFVIPFMWRYRNDPYELVSEYHKWTKPWLNPEDWTGGPQTYVNSLPKWWVVEQSPVYRRWWHPWANQFRRLINRPKGNRMIYPAIGSKSRGSGFWSFYKYHAFRNGANGLRSYELLDLDIVMDEVQWIGTADPNGYPLKSYSPWYARQYFKGSTYWYLTWQGWQAGFKFVHHWNAKHHMVIKIGWRVEPGDKYDAIDPTGIRVEDAGFATKAQPYRSG